MSEHPFKAGTAQLDITPPLGTVINGDFINHYAQRIHSNLYVKALVLSNEQTKLVFVVIDICVMRRAFIDEVKEDIFKSTGISKERILISATHTHGAPSIEELLLSSPVIVYRNKLAKQIVTVVEQALNNLKTAKIAFGAVEAPEHVLCRRYKMKAGHQQINPVSGLPEFIKTNPTGVEDKIIDSVAPVDPELSFLAIQSLENEWIGVLANYSLHYVGDWPNGTITADYFGEFATALQKHLNTADNFVAMMTNGTSGDVNNWDFKNPDRHPKAFFEKSRLVGNDLAIKISQAVENLEWETNPDLKARYKEVNTRTRKPLKEELPRYISIIENAKYETIDELNTEVLAQIYAREQLLLNEYPDTVDFPVQLFKIGNGSIGALAGEFFSETGLALKENQKNRYFTITMANGYVGYVPPKHELANGGYETWRCRSSYLAENAEELIRNELKSLTE